MGEVSYALMRILISRRIKQEVNKCVESFRTKAESIDRTDPRCIEQMLSLSVQLEKECATIALNILNEYEIEVTNDSMLQQYKKDLIHNVNKSQ